MSDEGATFDPYKMGQLDTSAARSRLGRSDLTPDQWSAGLIQSNVPIHGDEVKYGWDQYTLAWEWFRARERSVLVLERGGFALLALTATLSKIAAPTTAAGVGLTISVVVCLLGVFVITVSCRWPRPIDGPPTSRGLIAQPDHEHWKRAAVAQLYSAAEDIYERQKPFGKAIRWATIGNLTAAVLLAISTLV